MTAGACQSGDGASANRLRIGTLEAGIGAITATILRCHDRGTTLSATLSAFTVEADGTAVALVATDPVAVSGSTVTLTMTYDEALDSNCVPGTSAFEVKVTSWRSPGTGLREVIAGLANDQLHAFEVRVVNARGPGDEARASATPIKADLTPPALRSARVENATLQLQYDEPLDGNALPPSSAFTVSVDGSAVRVSGVTVTGAKVLLRLASETNPGTAVTVPYVGADSSSGQQALRLGVKLTSGPYAEAGFEFGRRMTPLKAPEHAVELRGSIRW